MGCGCSKIQKAKKYSKDDFIQIPANGIKRNYYSSDVQEIYLAKQGVASKKPMTVIDAINKIRKNSKMKSTTAFSWERNFDEEQIPREDWAKWSFGEFFDEAEAIASALVKAGTQHFEGLSIWGFNSQHWAGKYIQSY